MRTRESPLLISILVIGALALAIPASAQATISLSATSSPASVSGPPPWTGHYGLSITSGEVPARLEVFVADGYNGAARLNLGLSVTGAGVVEGRQEGSAAGPFFADPFSPGGVGPCFDHPDDPGGFGSVIVSLPPRSTATVATSQLLAASPWAGDSLGLRFFVNPVAAAPGVETVPDRQTVNLAGPKLKVARGVRIDFTSPRPRSEDAPRSTSVPAGRRVKIAGVTTPSIRGQVIKLVERSRPGGAARSIARVNVGKRGRFAFGGWIPRSPGAHLLGAVYRSQAKGLAGGSTRCGPVVIAH